MDGIYKHFAAPGTVFCLFLAGLCLATPVWAQEEPGAAKTVSPPEVESVEDSAPEEPEDIYTDPYTVEGVEVDVTADNAVQAREQALVEAQVKAYDRLAKRLLTPEELEHFQAPDADAISFLVQDFEVTNEQLSSVRYKGTFTIRFRQNAISSEYNYVGDTTYRQTPNQSGAPVSSAVLVLPFFQPPSLPTVLWDSHNPWMAAWVRASTEATRRQFAVPIGDVMDVSQIRDDQALTYNPQYLQQMQQRYQVGRTLILLATPEVGRQGVTALKVSLYDATPGRPVFLQDVNVRPQAGDSIEGLYDRAVAGVKDALAKTGASSSVETPVPVAPPQAYGQAQPYNARIHFSSVQEWVKAKSTLERLPGVQRMTVGSLRPREATVEIHYAGDATRLASALGQAGLELRSPAQGMTGYPADTSSMLYDIYAGPQRY